MLPRDNAHDYPFVLRPMRINDLVSVLHIQSCCYDQSKQESEASFLSKLQASPSTCLIAEQNGHNVSYLIALPSDSALPPPLHAPNYTPPQRPDCLYLHDLAIHPAARGTGIATALIHLFFQRAQEAGLRHASLTAVNNSQSFWARYGFQPIEPDTRLASRLASYGQEAQYMRLKL